MEGNKKDETLGHCYRALTASSVGIWQGENPLTHAVPLILYQLILIFISTRLSHFVLRRLGLPLVISQIIGGVLLGPSFLGRSKAFVDLLIAPRSWEALNIVSIFSFNLFVFMIGVKTDLGMIRKLGKKAVAIAIIGTVTPFILVLVLGRVISGSPKMELYGNRFFLLSLASKWSLSSYVVLSCVLAEMNLLTSKLGRLVMSASLVGEFFNQVESVVINAWVLGSRLDKPVMAVASFMGFVLFLVFLLLVARPSVLWMVRRTPEGDLMDQKYFGAVLLLAMLSALLSELLGFRASLGPFLFGLIIPGGPPLGVTVVERLERVVNGVFLPTFLATAGLRVDLSFVAGFKEWGLLELFLVVSIAGKFLGVVLPCLYCRMPSRDAIAVALMMISKGITEVDSATSWKDIRMINDHLYTMLMLTIVLVGGGSAPLVKLLYRPEDRFVANKRRTVEHMKINDELRVLACIHNQDHVGPILALLEGSYATKERPICLYILHLIRLVGRSATVLVPYKRRKDVSTAANTVASSSSSSAAAAAAVMATASETDHIMNAFRIAEEQDSDCVSILPYVCISPYSTMHDDICSIALDKKVFLIVLHFHQHVALDGSIQAVDPAVQSMNLNVLRYSPCSVALVVDHGLRVGPLADGLLQRVCVYFIGGPDCREALSCGKRLASHPAIGITLVRLRYDGDWREDGGREEKQDEEVIADFNARFVDGLRVQSREEVVRDGESTVAVMRAMSHQCSLLVVGRREGKDSPITDGLSAWSEYPELGVIGDMLASTDFGGRLSTFVVQQQRRYASGGRAEKVERPNKEHHDNQEVPPLPT